MKKVITIIMTVLMILTVSGCVSQNKYEDLKEQMISLKMQNDDLSKQITSLQRQNEGYTNRIKELEEEKEQLQASKPQPDIKADETSDSSEAAEPVSGSYIGNKRSKKFHKPTCGGLPEEQNAVYFDSRDAAVNAGYEPCKRCNP